MKNIIKFILPFVIILLILDYSGCWRLRGEKIRVGISFADTNNVEIKQIIKGFHQAPDSIKNQSELFIVSANNDTTTQTKQIIDLIDEKKIDVLILHCVNELRAREFLNKIEKEDIPVVSILNIPLSRQVYGYLTPDYFLTAKYQSQYVIDNTLGQGNVIILAGNSFSDMYTTLTYRNIDYLKKFPDINIVFQKFYNYPNEIESDVDSILRIYNNNIKAIIANDDAIILKAIEVLKKKKLEKKIITVGAGCTPDAVKSILNGELSMSVDLGYEDLGTQALTAAVDMMNLLPLKDNGLKYKNDEQKVSWILSKVKSYNQKNIKYLFEQSNKYSKSDFGLK